MKPNAYRDEDADAYWRRRVFILVGGMVILGLLAWALSGSGGSPPTPAARQAAMDQVRAANGLPSAAYGSVPVAAPVSPDAAGSPGVAAGLPGTAGSPTSPTVSRSPSQPAGGAKGAAAGKRVTAGKPAKARARSSRTITWCPSGSVVMTLFSAKPSYAPGERVVFDVYAVSTAASGCTFRFGPGAVRVIVTQHGRVVWNSAECPVASPRKVRLARGVPAEMSVTWNRQAGYGCRGWLFAGASGSFTAVARAGGQSSPAAYFELAR